MKTLSTIVGITALVAAPFVLALPFFGHMGGGWGGMMNGYDGNDAATAEEIRAARTEDFQKYDTNGDGRLSLQELQAVQTDGRNNRIEYAFHHHDVNGDSVISLDEYLNMPHHGWYGGGNGYGPYCHSGGFGRHMF